MDFLAGHFDLIRGLHIIFVMAWIAGMLILPRLFVYHMKTEPGSEMDADVQAGRAADPADHHQSGDDPGPADGPAAGDDRHPAPGSDFYLKPWALTKIAALIFLFAWHGFVSKARRQFAAGTNTRSEKFWRMTNELPFLAAIVIVLSVTTEVPGPSAEPAYRPGAAPLDRRSRACGVPSRQTRPARTAFLAFTDRRSSGRAPEPLAASSRVVTRRYAPRRGATARRLTATSPF